MPCSTATPQCTPFFVLRTLGLTHHNTQILCPATPYVVVPPRHYCIIDNPVERDETGAVIYDGEGYAATQLVGYQGFRVFADSCALVVHTFVHIPHARDYKIK